MTIKYDNERDSKKYGYDAGHIIDGTVKFDEELKRYVLIDEDGMGFDPSKVLESNVGKKVRLTIISFESIQALEKMAKEAGVNVG